MNTYSLFATTVIHSKIIIQPDLHKKILSHEKFISSDFDVNWLVKEKFS